MIKKHEVYRAEHLKSTTLAASKRNPFVCFPCLHYSVSEGAGYILIAIECRTPGGYTVVAKTVDGEAKAPVDYITTQETFQFSQPGEKQHLKVTIKDDDEWEPDKDFYIDLLDTKGDKLDGEDTRCRVTIIDDDRPGCLTFETTTMKHAAVETKCKVRVNRIHAFDGQVTCKYRTLQIDDSSATATPGKDYVHKEGTLKFGNGEAS